MRRLISWLLAITLLLSLSLPAGAADLFADASETEIQADLPEDVPEDAGGQAAEPRAAAVWDGSVDISWYDPEKTEFYLSAPAQLAGLAALVNGMTDPACPAVTGNRDYLESVRVEDYLLVGAGGGNVADTVYTSKIDFAYKTVYLTADMDMGGTEQNGTWSGPNWTPIGGKFPMLPDETGDCLTLDTRFNGVLDGQGHTVSNLYCDRYAKKGFPYSMAIGLVGFLGGVSDASHVAGTAEFEGSWQPAVRNLVLSSGSIRGRRMVGGIVGRVGKTSGGVVIEHCGNRATVQSTDAKGVGGIAGAAWGTGVIRGCYNTGYITTTYASPAGGILGSNEGMDVYDCYNAGTVYTSGNRRGRGIGNHDTGSYTVDNCYYLQGCGDDPDHPGYYLGTSTRIRVNVTELTEAQLKSADARLNASGAVFSPDSQGVNGGYPVLWFETDRGGGSCTVTLRQPSGGTVSVDRTQASFGQTVNLSCKPDTGYTLDYYTLNGQKLISDYFTATGDATVSAVFTRLSTVTVTIPTLPDCYVAVARQGWRLEGGELVWTDRELLRSGDTLVEGNILTVLTYGYPDASPEDLDLEYIDAYSCTLPGTAKNADGTYTVTGSANVAITVSRSTQKKTWITLADTGWYLSGGRRTEYTITTPQELAGLAYLVNKSGVTFAGMTVKLGGDISLQNTDGTVGLRTWTAIGSSLSRSFQGTFDGQGHAIYNMTAQSDSSYAGLFGCCSGAVIRNLSVYGTVSGNAKASYAAGIAAYMSGGVIEHCQNYAEITAAGTHAGGVAAMIRGGAQITDCGNGGSVTGESGLGGIVGVSDSGEDVISGCANQGAVTATGSNTYGTGGIVGRLAGTVLETENHGPVGGTDRYTGGIAGYTTSKNTSAIRQSANHGSVTSSNGANTAALGGVAGYAQFLILSDVSNAGTVQKGPGFQSAQTGDLLGREGTVTLQDQGKEIPAQAVPQARTFREEEKSSYTVTFTAEGKTVAQVSYRPGDSRVAEPSVPEKDGYTGTWDHYALGSRDITVKAVYRQVLVRDGDTVTKNGTYHITWFSSGEITVADGVTAVLDGSNGGGDGFDGLRLRVGKNARLTLKDTVLSGEDILLALEGGNTLTLEGYSELLSRADTDDLPAMLVAGDLTVDGSGSLYVTAGVRNAAVYVARPGSTVTLESGTLSVYKQDLMGFDGGAFWASGSALAVRGGVLKGHTVSDNVSVLSADSVTLSGGKLLLQAERAPAAIQARVTATGGTIAAYGHTGNSAAESRSYTGRDAITSYSGSAAFADFLPFGDVFVTDRFYDAVERCYEKGYFNGTSATKFEPDTSMTRAMFVTVLYRLARKPKVSGETPFTDLKQDWYKDAVAWAVSQGVTNGTSSKTFSPDDPVTREQAAVFLCRYAQTVGDTVEAGTGRSVAHGTLSDWAEAEALWALHGGLFDGARDPMADPQAYAPRSLLAVVVTNYDKAVGHAD